MCQAGFDVIDVYPMTDSYPSGTDDVVHYPNHVFNSVETLLEKYKALNNKELGENENKTRIKHCISWRLQKKKKLNLKVLLANFLDCFQSANVEEEWQIYRIRGETFISHEAQFPLSVGGSFMLGAKYLFWKYFVITLFLYKNSVRCSGIEQVALLSKFSNYPFWALALEKEMGPHGDREKTLTRVRFEPTTFGLWSTLFDRFEAEILLTILGSW